MAEFIRERFPKRPIIVCADDDPSEANPGLTKATEAARACGGLLAVPDFGPDRPAGATDFNDLYQHAGPEALHRALRKAAPPENPFVWEDPEPLTCSLDLGPYPIEALPKIIRDAVEEVNGFVKAPIPLAAASALSAASIAAQAHVDVKRSDRLEGPSSLFLLTIADSGERKSTCDGFFTKEIKAFESNKAEASKPEYSKYRAALEAWEAMKAGIKDDIRKLAKEDTPTDDRRTELEKHEQSRPQAPRVPRLLYTDATPEALAHSLATKWPAGGLVSVEAGLVFGSHGMSRDSSMRNMSMLNSLWDGNPLPVDRRTGDSFTVRGARFTMALQVQGPTLRDFLTRAGDLPRGIGFFARCLISKPESTQGTRMFADPPEDWPRLERFNHRIYTLLNHEPQLDGDHGLRPRVLSLSPEAKATWIAFHDEVERELSSTGKFQVVRDAASKAADNAARLAALFQATHSLEATSISAEYMVAGCTLARWYLYQALQFFGEMALPPEVGAAAELESWIVKYCHTKQVDRVSTTHIQKFGPGRIRKKPELEPALAELVSCNRARVVTSPGTKKCLQIHPELLQPTAAVPAVNARASQHDEGQKPQKPQEPSKAASPMDPLRDNIDSQNAAPDSDGGFDIDELVSRLK